MALILRSTTHDCFRKESDIVIGDRMHLVNLLGPSFPDSVVLRSLDAHVVVVLVQLILVGSGLLSHSREECISAVLRRV